MLLSHLGNKKKKQKKSFVGFYGDAHMLYDWYDS